MAVVGKIQCELKVVEWKISDFVSFIQNERCSIYFCSPSFSLGNVSFNLYIKPNWTYPNGFIQLFLRTNVKQNFPVKCYVGLKTSDGTTELLVSGILESTQTSVCFKFIKKTELLKRKSELIPYDVLTVTCTLKLMTEFNHFIQNEVILLNERKPLKLIKLDKLSENFKDLFGDEDTSDTTLKVKDKEYKAHRAVLIARSPVFAASFKHDTLEKQTGVIIIPDCDPGSFQGFLKYLYCGKLEECSYDTALNLYYTSDKYDVQELKIFCIEYLLQCLTVENMCEVGIFADKYDEMQLLAEVQRFFNRNFTRVLETAEWESLMKKDYRLANKLFKEMAKKVKLEE